MTLHLYFLSGLTFLENWKNFENWEPEIGATGGGNNEFQFYNFDQENIFIKNGILNIKPSFTKGDLRRDIELYSNGCTNNWNSGCFNRGSMHWNKGNLHWKDGQPIPVGGYRSKPFSSAKIVSKRSFGYGKLKITYKLPKGNYLWPAIWMLPENKYTWPTGGEIDIMESMGQNPESGFALDYKSVSAALHYGEYNSNYNISYTPYYEELLKTSTARRNLESEWQTSTLIRDDKNLIILINNEEIFNCDKLFRLSAASKPDGTIYKKELMEKGYLAGFKKYLIMNNINVPDYLFEKYNSPFDEKFKLIINLAVGGNFFTDVLNNNDISADWDNDMSNHNIPAVDFMKNINKWYNWGQNENENENYNENDNICSLNWEQCIKDSTPCDHNQKCWYKNEKHLANKRPSNISDNTAFKIGKITFEEMSNNIYYNILNN